MRLTSSRLRATAAFPQEFALSLTSSKTQRVPPNLSAKEEVILRILLAQGPLYGLEIVDASDGELKRGTVYVTLARMEDKGFLHVLAPPRGESTPGLPRPRYRISALGTRMLDAADLVAGRSPTKRVVPA